MAERKNYPEEFKRDAVGLVRSSPDRSLTDIAHGLGIHLETLRKWVRDDRTRTRAAGGGDGAGILLMRKKSSGACGGRTPG
ncbi:transposase [Streptomyces zaomyceticus]|uniref:transposase n=1 Tax=Streptomyces zaomyceticus TaxID=68286 RepID=UPI003436ACA1